MDINFPPPVLARKTFIDTTLMAVAFFGASYYFAISKDLEEEQPNRELEGAEQHHTTGNEALEGSADEHALPAHRDSDRAGHDHAGHDHDGHGHDDHDHGSRQEQHHD
jgi:hypothetical protein